MIKKLPVKMRTWGFFAFQYEPPRSSPDNEILAKSESSISQVILIYLAKYFENIGVSKCFSSLLLK